MKHLMKYLVSILFCVMAIITEVSAQATPVRFYIEVDTTRNGICVGQEVKLSYICTADYDSIMPPDFGMFIEVVKKPTPHRAGHTVRNGELIDIYEVGVNYQIRFTSAGRHTLPPASVKVNGKAYDTPPVSVWVKPVNRDMQDIVCELATLPGQLNVNERFEVTLTCNRQPDSNSPLLLINGRQIEPIGRSISTTNNTEKYQFHYYAQVNFEGSYTLSVENLSFGGISYTLPDREVAVAGGVMRSEARTDNSGNQFVWVGIGVGYVLFIYLLFWLRFRKESNEALADFVLRYHRLNLNTEWAYTHYGFPLAMLFIPFLFVGVNLYFYCLGTGEGFFPVFWCGALPLTLAFVSYRNQRAKLNFQSVATLLSVMEMHKLVVEVARQHNWVIDHMGEDCIVAHTRRSFPSLSWGEQIFIVFDENQVWINSVNSLNKRSAAASFGYTKKNIRLLKEAMEASDAN